MPNRLCNVSDLTYAWRSYRGEPLEPPAPFRVEGDYNEGRWIGMVVIDSAAAVAAEDADSDDEDFDMVAVAARTKARIFAMNFEEFWVHEFLLHAQFSFLFPHLPQHE